MGIEYAETPFTDWVRQCFNVEPSELPPEQSQQLEAAFFAGFLRSGRYTPEQIIEHGNAHIKRVKATRSTP